MFRQGYPDECIYDDCIHKNNITPQNKQPEKKSLYLEQQRGYVPKDSRTSVPIPT